MLTLLLVTALTSTPAWAQVELGPSKPFVNPRLVAEPMPTAETKAALLALEASATVVVERPTMRVWLVSDAAALRAKLSALAPVLNDLPSSSSRLKVLVGWQCGAQHVKTVSLAPRAGCLPDFWMKPVAK
jgi:hypothetical protein